MRQNYDSMKRRAGLIDDQVDEEDKFHVDEIFGKLRPGSPYKMSEMIQPDFNPKRRLDALRREGRDMTHDWRSIVTECSAEEVRKICMYNADRKRCHRKSSASLADRKKLQIAQRPVTHQVSYHRGLRRQGEEASRSRVGTAGEYAAGAMPQQQMSASSYSEKRAVRVRSMKSVGRAREFSFHMHEAKAAKRWRTGISFAYE